MGNLVATVPGDMPPINRDLGVDPLLHAPEVGSPSTLKSSTMDPTATSKRSQESQLLTPAIQRAIFLQGQTPADGQTNWL